MPKEILFISLKTKLIALESLNKGESLGKTVAKKKVQVGQFERFQGSGISDTKGLCIQIGSRCL